MNASVFAVDPPKGPNRIATLTGIQERRNTPVDLSAEARAYAKQQEKVKRFLSADPKLQLQMILAESNNPQEALQFIQALNDQSRRDALTKLGNRTAFKIESKKILAMNISQVAFIFFDLDHFKNYNTNYGHAGGDVALKAVADAAMRSVREPVFRWGGEEFVIMLPGSSTEGAIKVAKRVQQAVRNVVFTQPPMPSPMASFGVAVGVAASKKELFALFKAANEAMLAAKDAGRDQIALSKKGQECNIALSTQFIDEYEVFYDSDRPPPSVPGAE